MAQGVQLHRIGAFFGLSRQGSPQIATFPMLFELIKFIGLRSSWLLPKCRLVVSGKQKYVENN